MYRTCAHSYTYPNAYPDRYPYAYHSTNAYADTYAPFNTESGAVDPYGHSNANTGTCSESYTYPHTSTSTHSDSNPSTVQGRGRYYKGICQGFGYNLGDRYQNVRTSAE